MILARFAAAAAVIALVSAPALAGPNVPLYPLHVTATDKIGNDSLVVKTTDSVDTVAAWYRANLKDKTNEIKNAMGVSFFTKSGTTVAVSPGNRFDPGTKIGIVWDPKKYGPYTGK
jgi:hypothetical protein